MDVESEREDGEIVDGLEEVSDDSITSQFLSGKSLTYQDLITSVSVSSLSGDEYNVPYNHHRLPRKRSYSLDRKPRRKRRNEELCMKHQKPKKRSRKAVVDKSSSDSEYEQVDHRTLRQLKEAVRINKSQTIQANDLQTRLKNMMNPKEDFEDDVELDKLREIALLSNPPVTVISNPPRPNLPTSPVSTDSDDNMDLVSSSDEIQLSPYSKEITHDESFDPYKEIIDMENIEFSDEVENDADQKVLSSDLCSVNTPTPDNKDEIEASGPSDIEDPELRELRLAALKTAIMKKCLKRKEKKIIGQGDTNKENTQDNINVKNGMVKVLDDKLDVKSSVSESSELAKVESSKNLNHDVLVSLIDVPATSSEELEIVEALEKPVDAIIRRKIDQKIKNVSLDEDVDIMRANLLASMSEKITAKVVSKELDNIVPILKPTKGINPPPRVLLKKVSNFSVSNRVSKVHQSNLIRQSKIVVKPLIIRINGDSDSESESPDKDDVRPVFPEGKNSSPVDCNDIGDNNNKADTKKVLNDESSGVGNNGEESKLTIDAEDINEDKTTCNIEKFLKKTRAEFESTEGKLDKVVKPSQGKPDVINTKKIVQTNDKTQNELVGNKNEIINQNQASNKNQVVAKIQATLKNVPTQANTKISINTPKPVAAKKSITTSNIPIVAKVNSVEKPATVVQAQNSKIVTLKSLATKKGTNLITLKKDSNASSSSSNFSNKSVMSYMPPEHREEYRELQKRLMLARKKRVRRISQRALMGKGIGTLNNKSGNEPGLENVTKTKRNSEKINTESVDSKGNTINTEKAVDAGISVENKNTINPIKKVQVKAKTEAVIKNEIISRTAHTLKKTPAVKKISTLKASTTMEEKKFYEIRLQMKGKYKELSPLLKRIDEASAERRNYKEEINTLLQELQTARTKLSIADKKCKEFFTLLMKRKTEIDKGWPLVKKPESIKKGNPVIVTSTPIKHPTVNIDKKNTLEVNKVAIDKPIKIKELQIPSEKAEEIKNIQTTVEKHSEIKNNSLSVQTCQENDVEMKNCSSNVNIEPKINSSEQKNLSVKPDQKNNSSNFSSTKQQDGALNKETQDMTEESPKSTTMNVETQQSAEIDKNLISKVTSKDIAGSDNNKVVEVVELTVNLTNNPGETSQPNDSATYVIDTITPKIIELCNTNRDLPSVHSVNSEEDNHCDTSNNPCGVPEYVSPLTNWTRDTTSDPLATLCPFQLFGECKDPECTFKHS